MADRDAAGKIEKSIPLKPGKLGYFVARFLVKDAQNVLYSLWKEESFAVVDCVGDPAQERAKWLQPGGPLIRGNVYWRNAFVGLGLVREQIGPEVFDFEKGVLKPAAMKKLDEDFPKWNRYHRETGTAFHVMFGTYSWAKTPQDTYRFYKALLVRYGSQCKHWETTNEPNIIMKPDEYLEIYLKPLKLAAKEVCPDAVIMGPSGCGPSIDYVAELYRLGAKDYWDAVSIHPYVAGDYDIAIQPVIQSIRGIMKQYGDEKKPIYFTEGGFGVEPGQPGAAPPGRTSAAS